MVFVLPADGKSDCLKHGFRDVNEKLKNIISRCGNGNDSFDIRGCFDTQKVLIIETPSRRFSVWKAKTVDGKQYLYEIFIREL